MRLQSKRADRPFVTVHCPMLLSDLMSSTLFGHRKGAFTGAVSDVVGKVEAAESGTLFLDEVADLTADAPARLLSFLHDRSYERLGEAKETLEATLAALTNGVIVIDPGGRIAAANALARSVLQATGTAHAEFIDDLPFPPHGLRALRAALRGERTPETRAELSRVFSVSLDGRQYKFLLMVVPIPVFSVGRYDAVAVLYDVTDFARLDELRMELVAVASHELKTPLTTLHMNLLLLGEGADNLTPRQSWGARNSPARLTSC